MDVKQIVGLAVGLLVAAAILPSAIVTISNTTQVAGAPWNEASATILTLVPVIGIVAVVAVALMVLRHTD